MNRTKILAIVTAVSISACLYACGSDDDTNPVGGGGAGGHAGSKSGGSGGKGEENGGTGNEAGETSGGEGGALGLGGAGGDKGMAGDTSVGGDKNAGGEGGAAPVALTLAEACAATCVPAHTVATCGSTEELCVSNCTGYTAIVDAGTAWDADTKKTMHDDYLAMLSCSATKLPTVDKYACGDGLQNLWTIGAGTDCEAALCKWTCFDADYGTSTADSTTYGRCGCPL